MNKRIKKMYWSIGLSAVVILMLLASFFIQAFHPYRAIVLVITIILEIPIWLLQRK